MNKKELKEIIQSSNINFLIGAGTSTPFLPLLGDIETRLTAEKSEAKRVQIYREYFQQVILPNLEIMQDPASRSGNKSFQEALKNYKDFFELISLILLARKSTILSKQVSVFTTNIDILMETALEEGNWEYNDGFSGRLNPVFSLSNFKKSILKRSLHFENVSEIPVFNLIKIHGSLTWNKNGDKITISKPTDFDKKLPAKNDADFKVEYEKIAIVNPEPKKFKETVIDLTYYELLRMYSSELEKENTVLFVMGFSMADLHIREITIRAANSNPTLKIYILCHSKHGATVMDFTMNLGELKYSNIEIVGPEDDTPANKYTFTKINESIFKGILSDNGQTND